MTTSRIARRIFVGIGLLLSALPAVADDGATASIPFTRQYDFVSKITGIGYRVWITLPAQVDPAVSYPVIYALDGNESAGTVAFVTTKLSRAPGAQPTVAVSIGYPTEDLSEWLRRRSLDLTPTADKRSSAAAGASGGADAFIRVIDEEIKPLVASHIRIDARRQAIWGHSFGGLAVLRILFRHPTFFSTYFVSSPSIWWNKREILADEPAFAVRAKAGELKLDIHINSAGEEQYRGDDPTLLPAADQGGMIDNATELAQRVSALSPQIEVTRTIFPGETHVSAVSASLVRSLRAFLTVK